MQMHMEIDDVMSFQAFHTSSDVTSCAQEIMTYISNHDNWEKPILPHEPGCQEMVFEPERFDWVFNKWLCSETFDGNSISNLVKRKYQYQEQEQRLITLSFISFLGPFPDGISNSLFYELVVSDVLETSDGSSLNADCTRDYSTNAASKADSMTTEMGEAIETLCNDGLAEVLTYRSTFTVLGNQVNGLFCELC